MGTKMVHFYKETVVQDEKGKEGNPSLLKKIQVL